MSYKRDREFTVRVDEDAKLELERLAKASKTNQQIIASHAIMQVAPMRMLDPDWQDRMNALENVDKIFVDLTRLDDPAICDQMTYDENGHFVCVQGTDGRNLTIKKLSKDFDATLRFCSKCKISQRRKRELKTLNEENLLLKEMLKEEAKGKAILSPRCRKGAKPNSDLTELYCPENGAWRPVKERKKKSDPQPCEQRGMEPYQRCKWLVWDNIILNGKLPEMDKKR